MPEGGNGNPPLYPDDVLTQALVVAEERLDARFWISPEVLRRELKTIAETRMPTGIATLDKAFRGGLPGGTVVSLVGPPGSCKSAFALQLALKRAFVLRKKVYVYAPDQGGLQPMERLADTFGDVLHSDEAFARFCNDAAAYLRIADEREPAVNLEWFRDEVLKADDVAAVVIDTPQTVSTVAELEERQQINLTMETSRQIASRLLIPAFVAHHASRAATASRKIENRLLPRASGLGSASIEHRSQVFLFMEGRESEDDDEAKHTDIDVQVVKCTFGRAGGKTRLRLDVPRWRLLELDHAEVRVEEDSRLAMKRRVRLERVEEAILTRLKKSPEGLTGRQMEEVIGGNRATVREALRELERKGPLLAETKTGKGGGILWKLSRTFVPFPSKSDPT